MRDERRAGRADRTPAAGPRGRGVDPAFEERDVDCVVVPVDEVGGGARREAAQSVDRVLGVGRGHRRLELRVEERAASPDDELEEGAEEARLPAGEAEHEVGREELVPRVGHGIDAVGPHPQHAHVDQPGQAELRAVEAAQVDRARCQRRDDRRIDEVVERPQPLLL